MANNKKRLRLLSAILLLVAVLSVLSFVLFRYRNNLVKEKLLNELNFTREDALKKEIEVRNKELFSKTMLETERSKMYLQMITELKNVADDERLDEIKRGINSIVFRLSKNRSKDSWEEFNLRFNNVYDSFYEKLLLRHPITTSLFLFTEPMTVNFTPIKSHRVAKIFGEMPVSSSLKGAVCPKLWPFLLVWS